MSFDPSTGMNLPLGFYEGARPRYKPSRIVASVHGQSDDFREYNSNAMRLMGMRPFVAYVGVLVVLANCSSVCRWTLVAQTCLGALSLPMSSQPTVCALDQSTHALWLTLLLLRRSSCGPGETAQRKVSAELASVPGPFCRPDAIAVLDAFASVAALRQRRQRCGFGVWRLGPSPFEAAQERMRALRVSHRPSRGASIGVAQHFVLCRPRDQWPNSHKFKTLTKQQTQERKTRPCVRLAYRAEPCATNLLGSRAQRQSQAQTYSTVFLLGLMYCRSSTAACSRSQPLSGRNGFRSNVLLPSRRSRRPKPRKSRDANAVSQRARWQRLTVIASWSWVLT